MDVKHRLSATRKIIYYGAVPGLFQSLFPCNLNSCPEPFFCKLPVLIRDKVNLRYMLFGNDQNVYRGLRLVVFYRDELIILEDNFCWQFFLSDLAEYTILRRGHFLLIL